MTNQNVLVIDRVERYGIEMFRPVLVTIDSIGMVVGETKLGTSFFTEAGARTWVFETLRKDAQKRLSTYSNPQAG